MPMRQKITSEKARTFSAMSESKTKENPRKDTLSFIRQFAYSYHVEKTLPASLAGMIIN